VDFLPATQVKVADAEIGPISNDQRLPQGRQERLVNVVENAGHWGRTRFRQVSALSFRERESGPFYLTDCLYTTQYGCEPLHHPMLDLVLTHGTQAPRSHRPTTFRARSVNHYFDRIRLRSLA